MNINDRLFSDMGDDLSGDPGNDKLFGDEWQNFLSGGPGNDMLDGSGGGDMLDGEWGNDRLFGGEGVDNLFGGPGHDKLYGGEGRDYLLGGQGNDKLYGGEGVDTFVFTNRHEEGKDIIKDFSDEDRITFYGNSSDIELTQRGNNALIEYDNGQVMLLGVNASDLADNSITFA